MYEDEYFKNHPYYRCRKCGTKTPIGESYCSNYTCGADLIIYGEYTDPSNVTPPPPDYDENLRRQREEELRRMEEEHLREEERRRQEEIRKRKEQEERLRRRKEEEERRKAKEEEERRLKEEAERKKQEEEQRQRFEKERLERERRLQAEQEEKRNKRSVAIILVFVAVAILIVIIAIAATNNSSTSDAGDYAEKETTTKETTTQETTTEETTTKEETTTEETTTEETTTTETTTEATTEEETLYSPSSAIYLSAIAGTVGADSSSGCENLFDGDTGTEWVVEDFNGAYVIFEATDKVCLTEVLITTSSQASTYPSSCPVTWAIYGTNSGDDLYNDDVWDRVAKYDGGSDAPIANGKDSTKYTYSRNNGAYETAYKYFKLVITETAGDDTMRFSELGISFYVDDRYEG